ncbi:MAG TPA: energy-converting hydrogenase A, subunit K [Methanothermobacter thermautotrophicus]|jgi:energy-converting hydrogenase A subunit K|nr:energy-converting hydrogenase A, subunit K [Methanothermobacter sp.]HIH71117.1 energy-converting hydrogenase A, subunit K [Methanothermobacter thermautotrophicus]
MERDLTLLTALVAGGVIAVSLLAAIMQRMSVAVITILGVLFTVLLLLAGREGFSRFSEDLERAAFFAVLAMFIVSFIILYRPL